MGAVVFDLMEAANAANEKAHGEVATCVALASGWSLFVVG